MNTVCTNVNKINPTGKGKKECQGREEPKECPLKKYGGWDCHMFVLPPISLSDLSNSCEIINSTSWKGKHTYDNELFEGICKRVP